MHRQEKLEHITEKLGCKLSLRETWLTHIFDEMDTGCDAQSVDAAMEGHEAINTDANARMSY